MESAGSVLNSSLPAANKGDLSFADVKMLKQFNFKEIN